MDNLDANSRDQLVSVARGVVGLCPFIGSLASEAVGTLIPEQRLDRVVEFLRKLETDVQRLDARLEWFERNIRTPEGLDILEEALIQASRALSQERRVRLAQLASRSLTSAELRHDESRKVLNLVRDLTDPELVWLIFYSMNPTMGPGPHKDFVEEHPHILEPVSASLDAPQEEVDRAALQDSYKNTLLQHGLIEQKGRSYRITTLGDLVVRYIVESTSDSAANN